MELTEKKNFAPFIPTQIDRGRQCGRSSIVYNNLIAMMRAGVLSPDTRVREAELAKMMAVSRTPVREALTLLQYRGLLTSRDGGLVVTKLTRGQVTELYEMRAVLEGACARFAAERGTSVHIDALTHYSEALKEVAGDIEAAARVNSSFHLALYEAAQNSFQMDIIRDINDRLALLPRSTFIVEGRFDEIIVEHGAIIEAIRSRDPVSAENSSRLHIMNSLSARLRIL